MNTRRALDRTATALLVTLVLALVVAAVGVLLGWRLLDQRGGVMEPDIKTGSLLLTRPVAANSLHVGDVVSIKTADDDRITRRVVSVKTRQGSEVAMVVRSDATDRKDPTPYDVTSADRVLFHVPYLAVALSDVMTIPGLIVLGLVLLLLNMRGRSHEKARA